MSETRKTVCNRDCPDACGIVATVEKGRVTRLAGDPDHPVTRGFLCYRTSHFLATQYAPDRLTTPLVRDGDGFRPISWEDALDLAAERLTTIRRESGPAAIFHYRSGGSLGLLEHLTDYFFERFGPVIVKRGDICSGAGDAAQLADFRPAERAAHRAVGQERLHLEPVLGCVREHGACGTGGAACKRIAAWCTDAIVLVSGQLQPRRRPLYSDASISPFNVPAALTPGA
jgi:hypothetical protein